MKRCPTAPVAPRTATGILFAIWELMIPHALTVRCRQLLHHDEILDGLKRRVANAGDVLDIASRLKQAMLLAVCDDAARKGRADARQLC